MTVRIIPKLPSGTIILPPSKSLAHRYLIAAAFSDSPVSFIGLNQVLSADIEATLSCIRALGAGLSRSGNVLTIIPVTSEQLNRLKVGTTDFYVNESAATYRFFVSIAAVLGIASRFHLSGSLSMRPMDFAWEVLKSEGFEIYIGENIVELNGKLHSKHPELKADISSQIISGFLLASAILPERLSIGISSLSVEIPSLSYIAMTAAVMKQFGAAVDVRGNRYIKPAGITYHSPKDSLSIPADWSSAAFYSVLSAVTGGNIIIANPDDGSLQGDRKISDILQEIARKSNTDRAIDMDISDIPDLTPMLSVLALSLNGQSRLRGVGRLKYKESDRLSAIIDIFKQMNVDIFCRDDVLYISPAASGAIGGKMCFSSNNDHRIAMMLAALAIYFNVEMTILQADAVSKSYPGFWEDLRGLGIGISYE